MGEVSHVLLTAEIIGIRMHIAEQVSGIYRNGDQRNRGLPKEETIMTSNAIEVKAELLIRKPVSDVFEAMVNPEITSRFWFTGSTGRVESGKEIEWTWSMYNATAKVSIQRVERDRFISFTWMAYGIPTLVEMTFTPHEAGTTFVSIVEKGWDANDERLIETIVGDTEGWTLVLSALKALLEHNVILTVVADRFPQMHG
jgi:uncharacterized protein YndB with AHSA1/START domain